MVEHVHGCLSCRPDMVPDFDRADPRYHDGEKCLHRITSVSVDGVDLGLTQGIFEGREGWALYAGADASEVHLCPCDHHHTCVEPRFGAVTVEHAAPVLIDVAEVMRRLPKGWPGPEGSPEVQARFVAGWEPFWRWLHKEARQWS